MLTTTTSSILEVMNAKQNKRRWNTYIVVLTYMGTRSYAQTRRRTGCEFMADVAASLPL